MINPDRYEIISLENMNSFPIVYCYKPTRRGILHCGQSSGSMDFDIIATIAYNLHRLDSVMPADFASKISKVSRNFISIGEWKFLDTAKMEDSKFAPRPKCCIGFDLILNKPDRSIFVGFGLHNPAIVEHISDEFAENCHQTLFFTEILKIFCPFVAAVSQIVLRDTTINMYRVTPDQYIRGTYDFSSLDKYIAAFPHLINKSDCKYGHIILTNFCKTIEGCIEKIDEVHSPVDPVDTDTDTEYLFTHIMKKYDLKLKPETYEKLMRWSTINNLRLKPKTDEEVIEWSNRNNLIIPYAQMGAEVLFTHIVKAYGLTLEPETYEKLMEWSKMNDVITIMRLQTRVEKLAILAKDTPKQRDQRRAEYCCDSDLD